MSGRKTKQGQAAQASIDASVSAGKLDVVLDSVDAAVITIDRNGFMREVNAATSRLFGYPADVLIGSNVSLLMPEPDRSRHDDYLRRHLQTGEARILGTGRRVQARHANGSTFPVHLAVGRHELDGDVRFTGIVHDLTRELRQYEDAIRLGALLDESLNEIFLFDANTLRFTQVSRGALANLGYSQAEMRKMTPLDIKPLYDSERFDALLHPLREGREHHIRFDTVHQRKDGSLYDVELSISISSTTDGAEFVAIARDITERNQLVQTLHRAQKLETVGQLTGGIAHDFNNLLTVISGNLEMLAPRVHDSLSGELIRDAVDAAAMGARLTSRLLAFASRSSLSPERVDLNALVLELVDMLRRTLGEKIALHTSLSPSLWPTRVDVSQLESALLNLAVNARDAMPDGGRLSIETGNRHIAAGSIECGQVSSGDYVELRVTDTGLGIDEERQSRIFEPFYSTKPASLGTGLGLSMVYGFARQSGGGVDVDSRPGQGASFRLLLPRDTGSAPGVSAGPPTVQARVDLPRRILLVEDDDQVRRLVRRQLQLLGHTVVEATDGYTALRVFRQLSPLDLVFSDMIMSEGMNGYDLALAVMREAPGVRVLLSSGYADELLDTDALSRLGIELLRKPYSFDELRRCLSAVFAAPAPTL